MMPLLTISAWALTTDPDVTASGSILVVGLELRGRDPNEWPVVSPSAVLDFFGKSKKHVIYFAGYGELGYEDSECVRRIALEILRNFTAKSTTVLCGTLLRVDGHDGIAEVYVTAKELGFETVGIHPSVAIKFAETHRVSPCCDHVFFVPDDTWGGYMPTIKSPSPTLGLHLAVSDEIVVIGGGKHTADELAAFSSAGKEHRYFPAEMNLSATQEWCARAGVEPLDRRGAAYHTWLKMTHNG